MSIRLNADSLSRTELFCSYVPLVHCSFKLLVQRQTHSMRLRSSVIKTLLLGGDWNFMAKVIAEASVKRPTVSKVWVSIYVVQWAVSDQLVMNALCNLSHLYLFLFALYFKNFLQESFKIDTNHYFRNNHAENNFTTQFNHSVPNYGYCESIIFILICLRKTNILSCVSTLQFILY